MYIIIYVGSQLKGSNKSTWQLKESVAMVTTPEQSTVVKV